jgi:predicted Zn-ribbon and HTH transcriptional regulator
MSRTEIIKYECADCGYEWNSWGKEEECPECLSSLIYGVHEG